MKIRKSQLATTAMILVLLSTPPLLWAQAIDYSRPCAQKENNSGAASVSRTSLSAEEEDLQVPGHRLKEYENWETLNELLAQTTCLINYKYHKGHKISAWLLRHNDLDNKLYSEKYKELRRLLLENSLLADADPELQKQIKALRKTKAYKKKLDLPGEGLERIPPKFGDAVVNRTIDHRSYAAAIVRLNRIARQSMLEILNDRPVPLEQRLLFYDIIKKLPKEM